MSDATKDQQDASMAGGNKPERPTGPTPGFLEGFLAAREAEENESTDAEQATVVDTPPTTKEELHERIVGVLRQIYDPEIPVNIFDMGLIYEIAIRDEDWHVTIMMTLTSPNCPVAEIMPGEVEVKVGAVAGVKGVELQLVWDPPWDMSKMSDDARLELGLL